MDPTCAGTLIGYIIVILGFFIVIVVFESR
jgi:hypothetical protein